MRAFGARLLNGESDAVRRRGAYERSEGRLRVERIAGYVASCALKECCEEAGVNGTLGIDAADAAAGLAGVEEGAICEFIDRAFDVRISADVGRVVAAEFQHHADEPRGRGMLNCPRRGSRPSEDHMSDARIADEPRGV